MKYILSLILIIVAVQSSAQTYPTCKPSAIYTTPDGEKDEVAAEGESAPLPAQFFANPQDTVGWKVRYEWTIARQELPETYIVRRFDENIDYTFTQSGVFVVTLNTTFTTPTDTISYGEPGMGDDNTFIVSIQQSLLDFPNTFTPNGDGINDTFRAKPGYQSIISFEATIFNRWGQQLYSWTDLDGEWDGKYNGTLVKDGAYYLVVKAKGADGINYNIRRAINVLTSESRNGTGSSTN